MNSVSQTEKPLLNINGLVATFPTLSGVVRAVDGIDFAVHPGEILGIVGESGSGKSVTSRSILRMIRPPGRIESGTIDLRDADLRNLSDAKMRAVRGRDIAMIFQDPQAALNPVMTVGSQIEEAVRVHGGSRSKARQRTLELLGQVGIPTPEQASGRFPHEFSGGMRQRIVIAIALANNPTLLIADEPTTALDVTIQAQVLDLIRRLRDELGIAIIFITHDMAVVAEICDNVLVMNHGAIVERGSVEDVLTRPRHPYTQKLMAAVPRMDSPFREPVKDNKTPTLVVTDLRTDVNTPTRSFIGRRHVPVFAVDGVSLSVSPGETLGLVGESGCGKSTLSRTIVGINRPTSGTIEIDRKNVTSITATGRRDVARAVQYVFQDPFSSLNPRRTAGQSLEEALAIAGVPRRQVMSRAGELLKEVGLGPEYLDRYPHAFSGGQRQRVGIARALAADPKILILDEPVSALDVSIQAQILELLTTLQDKLGLGYLFISHDLSVVREISHRVAVMYKGKIVEMGTAEQVFHNPAHPYTAGLLASTPDPRPRSLRTDDHSGSGS